jgi:hypothetical protein
LKYFASLVKEEKKEEMDPTKRFQQRKRKFFLEKLVVE